MKQTTAKNVTKKFAWPAIIMMMMILSACTLTPSSPQPAARPENSGGCDDPLGCVILASDEPVRLAGVFALTEATATLGVDSQYGAQIAIDEWQTVAGHNIQFVIREGGCSVETGQAVAADLAGDEKLTAVIGHNCSGSCRAAAPIYDEAGLTMVSPSCTAPLLTAPDQHRPSFLRTVHNDSDQAKAMAELAYHELGLRTAATIHDGSLYAEHLEQAFVETFTALGGQMTDQVALDRGRTDLRPLLAVLAEDEPDMVYYPIFLTEAMFVTAQARQTPGLEDTVLAGADTLISDQLISQTEGAAEGMYISGMAGLSGENYDQFKEDYQRLAAEDPLHDFHAHAFDAVDMVLAAIERVARTDTAGNTVIGRAALREALYATRDLAGLTGTLTCNQFGDCADPNIVVNQIQDGRFVPVYRVLE